MATVTAAATDAPESLLTQAQLLISLHFCKKWVRLTRDLLGTQVNQAAVYQEIERAESDVARIESRLDPLLLAGMLGNDAMDDDTPPTANALLGFE